MGILQALRSGHYGVRFACPRELDVESDSDDAAKVQDDTRNVTWHFFMFPKLQLELSAEHEGVLRRDAENHARYLLESLRRTNAVPSDVPTSVRSPLVSCDRIEVSGHPALSILHRMANQPGKEIVMGHLLIPLSAGVLEVRWLAGSQQTGVRESMILESAMGDNPEADPRAVLMKSLDYDNERYDADFPDNVLTVCRRAGNWIRREAGLHISAPATPSTTRTADLAKLSCTLVPPPRFVLDRCNEKAANFRRVLLAGNDGVQYLTFRREASAGPSLEERAARTLVDEVLATHVTCSRVDVQAPLAAAVVAEGTTGGGPMRVIVAGFTDSVGQWCVFLLLTSPSQPLEITLEELAASAETFRVRTRPWWRIW